MTNLQRNIEKNNGKNNDELIETLVHQYHVARFSQDKTNIEATAKRYLSEKERYEFFERVK